MEVKAVTLAAVIVLYMAPGYVIAYFATRSHSFSEDCTMNYMVTHCTYQTNQIHLY